MRSILTLLILLLSPASIFAQDSLWKAYMDAGTKAYGEARYPDAERRLNLAVKEAERFGPQDPRVAESHFSLALVYVKQPAKFAQALAHSRQSLEIWGKVIWGNKPRTESLTVANNLETLASALLNTREYADIELLLKQALSIKTKFLRADHPALATTLGYLAITNLLQKEYEESAVHYTRALDIYNKSQDVARYEDIIQALGWFSVINRIQGNYSKAEEFLNRAIEIRAKSREPEYADSDILKALAELLTMQHRYREAEGKLLRRLKIVERAYGLSDPHIASALDDLGSSYLDQEKYSEAEPVFERSLAIQEKVLPADDASLAMSLNNLAKVYYYVGKNERAEPLYMRAIEIAQKLQNPSSNNLARYSKNLALLLYAQGKNAEGESLLQKALNMLSGTQKDRLEAFASYELADLFLRQKQYDEAEPWFKKAKELMEKIPGQDQYDLANALEKYSLLLRHLKREIEAIPLETKAKEIKSKYGHNP